MKMYHSWWFLSLWVPLCDNYCCAIHCLHIHATNDPMMTHKNRQQRKRAKKPFYF
jgi:cytochrome c biogenesis protein ResB